MRTILDRYLAWRCALPALIALVLICGLLLALQLLRLGHHLAGAPLSGALLLRLLSYSLPTLLVFALPLSLVAGVLFGVGRLAETGQLQAMAALGWPPRRAVQTVGLLALLFGAVASGAALAEPGCLVRLYRAVQVQVARALVLSAEPRIFHRLGVDGETLIHFDERLPSGPGEVHLARVLLARHGAAEVLVARTAVFRFLPGTPTVELELQGVELQARNRTGGLQRVRIDRYRERLDLGLEATQRHFGFLGQRAGRDPLRAAALSAPGHCLALALVGLAVALGTRRRVLAAGLAAALAAAYQLSALLLEGFFATPAAGPLALAGVTAAGSLALLLLVVPRRLV